MFKGEIEHNKGLLEFEAKMNIKKMEEIAKLAENYEKNIETIGNAGLETAKEAIKEGLDLLKKTSEGRIKAHEFYEKKSKR